MINGQINMDKNTNTKKIKAIFNMQRIKAYINY